LDAQEPDAAVFTCEAAQQGGYAQQGQSQQGQTQQGQTQLPYPWVQLADQNGAVYYSNPLTGEASWDPPQ
jgi:hypothetical protein